MSPLCFFGREIPRSGLAFAKAKVLFQSCRPGYGAQKRELQTGVPRSGLASGVPRTSLASSRAAMLGNLDPACAPGRLDSSDVSDLGVLDLS